MDYHTVLPFAVAVIKDVKGLILIGQQPMLDRKPYPGYWDLPGGKVEEGESCEECITRELKEELGVNVTSVKLVSVFHHSGKNILKECKSTLSGLGICYEVEIEGEIKPTEQDNIHFSTGEELSSYKLTPWTKYFLLELNYI
jgi:mutator protein MutT